MNEKITALGEHCFRAIFIFHEHKSVYCVYTRNLGANPWLLLGAKSMPFGCMSMERLGAKYAVVGCKVCGNSWVHVCGCWVHLYGNGWLHVCGCWVQSMRLLGACLTVGSYCLHAYPTSWAQGPPGPWPKG